MSIPKTLLAPLLVLFLFLHLSESAPTLFIDMVQSQISTPVPQDIDCGSACDARCQLSSRPNLCKRACGTCCERCKCVPPGTSGNYGACPCYANMTTHGGKHKCP